MRDFCARSPRALPPRANRNRAGSIDVNPHRAAVRGVEDFGRALLVGRFDRLVLAAVAAADDDELGRRPGGEAGGVVLSRQTHTPREIPCPPKPAL